jgi:hypothetical protein
LPLDGFEDARPAVAPAPFGLPVADEAAVGGELFVQQIGGRHDAFFEAYAKDVLPRFG